MLKGKRLSFRILAATRRDGMQNLERAEPSRPLSFSVQEESTP